VIRSWKRKMRRITDTALEILVIYEENGCGMGRQHQLTMFHIIACMVFSRWLISASPHCLPSRQFLFAKPGDVHGAGVPKQTHDKGASLLKNEMSRTPFPDTLPQTFACRERDK
jgi:hypothetical protein